MTTTIGEVREFTNDDWCSFGGAESWDDSQPLIYEHSDLNVHTTVIASRDGIEVIEGVEDHVGYSIRNYRKEMSIAPALAKLWMPALALVSPADLLRSGFTKISDDDE